jgi:hypothetical protein
MVATASTGGTSRAFGGKHDGIGTFEDRGRDIRNFRACRHGRADHRFEHLRRDNNRLAGQARHAINPLLQTRNFFERHLDSEVAARDH